MGELPGGCWEPNESPPEDQEALLTTKSPLLLPSNHFYEPLIFFNIIDFYFMYMTVYYMYVCAACVGTWGEIRVQDTMKLKF